MVETTREANKSAGKAKAEYTELEIVRDPDGVIAVITKSSRDGRISFKLAREFEQNGTTKQTPYLARRHLPAIRRLLADLEERLDICEDQARAKLRDR